MGGITHYNKISGINGIYVGPDGSEVLVSNSSGVLLQAGVSVTSTAAELNKLDGATVTTAEINTLDLSAVGAIQKIKKIAIAAGDGTSENDTGWTLPADAIVLDVFLNISAAEATGGTKTIDIGTDGSGSNDPDGFADAISVAGTGLVRPQATLTAGGSETYFSANTRGVLLSDFLAGSDSATDVGTYREKPDLTSGGESITWTPGSGDFVEFAADLFIVYIEVA